MKKFYFMAFIATAALTMTSCSNDDFAGTGSEISKNEAAQAINFSTYLGRAPQSRAGETTSETIKKDGFGVFASYTTTDWSTNNALDFMYNQEVKQTNSKWTYSPVKYWPSTGKLSFFAYAPYCTTGNGISIKTATADTKGAPTATVSLATIENQSNAIDPSKMIDFTVGCKMNQTDKTQEVALKLKHEMTRVTFKATGDNLGKETTVTVTKIELSGAKLYKTATYTFPTKEDGSGKWSDTSNESNTVTLDNLTLTGENTSDALYLIPVASLGGQDVSVKITYTVSTADNNLADNSFTSKDYTQTVNLPESSLAQGKSYVYTFKIGLNEVKLSADVTSWSDNTDNITVSATE